MKGNAVGWFEIYVDDMKRAKAFYETVFDVALYKIATDEIELWVFPEKSGEYGAHGALAKMEGVCAGGNSTIVYFSCADCGVEEAKALKAGGKVLKPKFSIGENGFISLLYDTEGNIIGLHSFK